MEIDINNDILVWAVERAGFDLDEISRKVPNFTNWLMGNKKPTLKQLEVFAQKVHLPFGYLFLKNPPEEKLPIPFFRTISSQNNNISLNIYDTVILLQQRQTWLSDYLKDNDFDQLNFVGKFKNSTNIFEIASDIKAKLHLDNTWADNFSNWEQAKDYLSQKIEDSGIIVVFNGVVGNNTHRKIDVNDCRGFVLTDDYVPFMFINSADSKAAQMFTLAHELAHIWIGYSAGFDLRSLQPAANEIEILCDRIAAEFLVPKETFMALWENNNDFEFLAKKFKVSKIVIARRALDFGKINREDFFAFYNDHMSREFRKKENREGGGDFYNTQKKRLSIRFLSFVNQAVKQNKLLVRDAYQITGMKGNTYHKFVEKHIF